MSTVESIRHLEAAAVRAWPATIERRALHDWLLRATPGLDRARSNHALTPCRPLAQHELAPAIELVIAFAHEHAITPGIQVSPLTLHARLQRELDAQGWLERWPVLVLTGPTAGVAEPQGPATPSLELADRATPQWLRTWAQCEPGRDVEAHACTVFARLHDKATFARLGELAVAISVEDEGLVGLYCLAVAPSHRRAGVGTRLVCALLARARATAPTAYLQVEETNAAALAMYARLGFSEAYRYCHRTAPDG